MKLITSVLALLTIEQSCLIQNHRKWEVDGLKASGAWEESHEAMSLFCLHVTNAVEVMKGHSEASCFLTEV